jgi:hypothetical protein
MVASYHWQNANELIRRLTPVDRESVKDGSILPLAECYRTYHAVFSCETRVCHTWQHPATAKMLPESTACF